MKQKKILSLALIFAMLISLLTGCGHEHKFGDWELDFAATCSQSGQSIRKCTCGEVETQEIPMLQHEYESQITKEVTCLESGENTFTCRLCGDSYVEDILAVEYASTELYAQYKDRVGEITYKDKMGNERGLGTGFLFQQSNQVLTNFHVMESAYSASITFGDTAYEIKNVLAYDPDIDLAVLEIDDTGMEAVPVCDLDHPVGSPVYALGSSLGLTATFSDGMITADREDGGVRYVQHDVPISQGNSGGPLINTFGEVIGINTWGYVEGQNLNFAIHIAELDYLDYSNPMSIDDFYNTVSSPYARLAELAMEHGDYDRSYDGYDLILGEWDGEYLERFGLLYYAGTSDTIVLYYEMENADLFFIEIDSELSGEYAWYYSLLDEYEMSGTLLASTYEEEDLLSYEYCTSGLSEEDISTLQSYASISIAYLCNAIDECLADFDIYAFDLGFFYYG